MKLDIFPSSFIRVISMNDSECLDTFITYLQNFYFTKILYKENQYFPHYFVINFGKELLNDSYNTIVVR